jgi:uncharacterized protein YjaZ
MINDLYILYGKPDKRLAQAIYGSLKAGLMIAREKIKISQGVTFKIYVSRPKKYAVRDFYLSDGHAEGKRTIFIDLSKLFFKKRDWRQRLVGTTVHEYTHLLRHGQGRVRTVVEAVVEEGVAVYMQTRLTAAPDYLDIKTLNQKMVGRCWNKLENVLDEPVGKQKIIWQNEVYREIHYRFGFGIVRDFVKANKIQSFEQLVKTPRSKFISFARGKYKTS